MINVSILASRVCIRLINVPILASLVGIYPGIASLVGIYPGYSFPGVHMPPWVYFRVYICLLGYTSGWYIPDLTSQGGIYRL